MKLIPLCLIAFNTIMYHLSLFLHLFDIDIPSLMEVMLNNAKAYACYAFSILGVHFTANMQ